MISHNFLGYAYPSADSKKQLKCMVFGYAAYSTSKLLWASLVGNLGELNILKATLNKGNNVTLDVGFGQWTINPEKATFEIVIQSKLERVDQHHLIIAHRAVRGEYHSEFDGNVFALVDDEKQEPEAQMFDLLSKHGGIHIDPSWQSTLWMHGRSAGRVEPLMYQNGVKIWRINTDTSWWSDKIQDLIARKVMSPLKLKVAHENN